jgi:hypothetical protein
MMDWFLAPSPLITLPLHLMTGTGRTTGAGLAVAEPGEPLLEGLVTVNVTVSAGAFLVTFTVAVIWVELTTLTLLSLTELAPSVRVRWDGRPGSDWVKKQPPLMVMSCFCPVAHHPSGVTEVMVGVAQPMIWTVTEAGEGHASPHSSTLIDRVAVSVGSLESGVTGNCHVVAGLSG